MAFTEPSGISGFLGLFRYANEVTDDWFAYLVLIGIYSVIILVLMQKDIKGAFVSAGFTTAIAATLLRVARLIDNYGLFIAILLCAIPYVWFIFHKDA